MSNEPAMHFVIEYYAGDELKVTDNLDGPLKKAESEAVIGMIRHLYSGVDCARILDPSGQEVNSFRAPLQTASAS
jgi:hypothetical protein